MIIVLQVNNRKNILICENQNKVEGRKWELLLTRMALISGQTLVNFLIQIHIAVNEVQMKLIKGEVLKIFSFT